MKKIFRLTLRLVCKDLCMLLIFLLTFLSNCSTTLAKVKPIIPYLSDHTVLGLRIDDEHKTFTPYLWAGYDLDYEEGAYKVGGKIEIVQTPTGNQTKTWLDLNYGHWPSHELAGYPYQHGFTGGILRDDGETKLAVTVFNGEIGEGDAKKSTADPRYSKAIKVTHLHINYNRLLFQDWDKKAHLIMTVTSGRPNDGNQVFSVTTWTLPLQIGNFRWKTQARYIDRCDLVFPYFDLADLVRGYEEKVKTGNRSLGMTMEKHFQPFPYSDLPFISLLHLTAFVDVGGVLPSGEALRDLEFHHCLGGGFLLALGRCDLRLEGVVTDEDEEKILFYIDAFFPVPDDFE